MNYIIIIIIKIPCLGVYALGWDRTIDPLITRRKHEPVRHSTPTITMGNISLKAAICTISFKE